VKWLGWTFATIGGILGGWAGARLGGIFLGFIIGMVGTGAGLYIGRRISAGLGG